MRTVACARSGCGPVSDGFAGRAERGVTSVIPHTYAIGTSVHRDANGGIDHVPALRRAHSRDDFFLCTSDY
jgi:hypothetical protein